MSTFPLLLLLSSIFPFTAKCDTASTQASLHDNSQNCTCYTLDSDKSPAYFLYHKFYDFRSLPATPEPPLVTANQRWGKEQAQDQDTLNSSQWNNDWGIQSWGKKSSGDAPVAMQNSAGNVFIAQDNTSTSGRTANNHLTLRTTRLPTFQSVSEIENLQKNLFHASLRFRARIQGSAGAVAGLFTFVDDNNESDIEILTSDAPTTYRFTNQPSTKKGEDIPNASKKIDNLPPWNEWRTQRIDWLPDMSRWFLDGVFVAANTYSVPRKPSGLVLNMWSDGGVWSGNMTVGESAELQIEWIQVLFNTSGSRDGPGGKRGSGKVKRWVSELVEDVRERSLGKREAKYCTVICKVDGVEKVGYPEVAYLGAPGAASSASVLMRSWTLVVLVGVVSVLVL